MVLRVFHGWIRAATTREFIKEEKRDSRRWLFKESILQYNNCLSFESDCESGQKWMIFFLLRKRIIDVSYLVCHSNF